MAAMTQPGVSDKTLLMRTAKKLFEFWLGPDAAKTHGSVVYGLRTFGSQSVGLFRIDAPRDEDGPVCVVRQTGDGMFVYVPFYGEDGYDVAEQLRGMEL
jgi:hypothetical protein